MNTHNNINNHYLTCPICQNNGEPRLIKSGSGLFTCPYCQERLVVSRSGHYVKDPFVWKQIIFCESSCNQRRRSSKTFRNSPLLKRSLVSLILIVSILAGMIFATQHRSVKKVPEIPETGKLDWFWLDLDSNRGLYEQEFIGRFIKKNYTLHYIIIPIQIMFATDKLFVRLKQKLNPLPICCIFF